VLPSNDLSLPAATSGLTEAMVSVINQMEGPIITLRDGRNQVKFPPTRGKPTTFRAKCERPLQSVMNFGSAAIPGIGDRQL
jgi:hypothetical protein